MSTVASTASSLIFATSRSIAKSYPRLEASRSKATRSFGKQYPPYPRPAFRNAGPMRESAPMTSVTASTSALAFSHRRARAFA